MIYLYLFYFQENKQKRRTALVNDQDVSIVYSITVVSLKIRRIFKNIISVSPNFGILDRELLSLFSRSITHHGIIGIVNITAGKLTFNIHRKQVANVLNSFIRGNYVTVRSWVLNK